MCDDLVTVFLNLRLVGQATTGYTHANRIFYLRMVTNDRVNFRQGDSIATHFYLPVFSSGVVEIAQRTIEITEMDVVLLAGGFHLVMDID